MFSHPKFESCIKSAISEVIALVERQLIEDGSIETNLSGSTLVLAVIRGRTITIANIGDSRIILASRNDMNSTDNASIDNNDHDDSTLKVKCIPSVVLNPSLLTPHRLSRDHKPDIPEEKERILLNGGRVFALSYDDGEKGPARVWLSNMNAPGLAMSRSLCDRVAHTVGVISTPEFFEYELNPLNDCFLIMATDGLWEFISDQEVVDITVKSTEPSDAINTLIIEATKRWMSKERSVDDASICVAFLEGSTLLSTHTLLKSCEEV